MSGCAPSQDDSNDEQHQGDEKENFHDISNNAGDLTDAKQAGDDRNYNKNERPVQHSTLSSIGFGGSASPLKLMAMRSVLESVEQSVCPEMQGRD
jgi:hypothetical protein